MEVELIVNRISPTDREAEKWRGFYDQGGYAENTVSSSIALRVVRWHRRSGANPGEALDLGCGQGFDLEFLAEHGYQVTGVDFAERAVEDARARLQKSGQVGTVLVGDLRSLGLETWPLENRQFNVVIAVDVLNLLGKDADRVLRQLSRLIAPGGIIGINSPDINLPLNYDDGSGRRWFTLEELEDAFAGWELIEKTVTTFGDGDVWGGIILRRPVR